jgi:hypothetical protein
LKKCANCSSVYTCKKSFRDQKTTLDVLVLAGASLCHLKGTKNPRGDPPQTPRGERITPFRADYPQAAPPGV